MRTVLFTALVMMLSACGLNQPGADNKAESKATADSTELPVVQQPVEAANDQMQSMDSESAAMEASNSEEPAQAAMMDGMNSGAMESSEPAKADMEQGKDMQQDAIADESSEQQDKVSDKTKAPESPDQKS